MLGKLQTYNLQTTEFYEKGHWKLKLPSAFKAVRAFRTLTRAWPGSQPNAIDRGGGAYNAPPQANSQTNDRSETGKAALERSRRDGSKALLKLFLKGHVSGQGQAKCQNWAFQHFGSQNRQLTQTGPNSAETLSKVRPRYCMSVNAILSTGQGHGQVTKGHYIQKSHCGHVIHVL